MACYRVNLPRGTRVGGLTADGQPATVLPGEYLVDVLEPRIPAARPVARFVGADPSGRDVHVPLEVAGRYLAASANDGARFNAPEAA